jgi:hypothetical protein
MDEIERERIPNREAKIEVLRNWINNLPIDSSQAQESQIEAAFITSIFGDVLGYTLHPYSGGTAWMKPAAAVTKLQGTPDVVLGSFGDSENSTFKAVVELKSPGCDLDRPQASHSERLTPVEQAFRYGTNLLGVKWVLVSDMRTIRLYAVEADHPFWTFDLTTAARDDDEGRSAFNEFWWMLSFGNLLDIEDAGSTELIYERSSNSRVELRESFYEIYFQIRADLFEAIGAAATNSAIALSRDDQLESTQRLLDRMIFIFYCEDHPMRLIPKGTVQTLIRAARSLPGSSTTKIYDVLKGLFREVDEGSPEGSGLRGISAYNGELFKPHPVIDIIELQDSLNVKTYRALGTKGRGSRRVVGIWGLNNFDFWQELGEHMLGQVFEESLSDLISLGLEEEVDLAAKLDQRKKLGVYYTTDVLSNFMAETAIPKVFDDRCKMQAETQGHDIADPHLRLDVLSKLRIVDMCCGSGAFLVSSYKVLLREFWRIQDELLELQSPSSTSNLFDSHEQLTQASLLRETVFGVDLLPQAVEIAKLALWLGSARPGEKVSDLSSNIVTGDSLDLDSVLAKLQLNVGSLDLVIGNPPWGAQMDPLLYANACRTLNIDDTKNWDSWEIFVLLGLRALRSGGRLCLVLPDSLLYPDKDRIRERLVEDTTIARLHLLGPSWFGPNVRMGTTILEVVNTVPGMIDDIRAVLLSGKLRKLVISGKVPLTQVETQRGRWIPQSRSKGDNHFSIDIFHDRQDDTIFESIYRNSQSLDSICIHGRGEEMSKSGLYWICPSCMSPTVPGAKLKGGRLADKLCAQCGATLHSDSVESRELVIEPEDDLLVNPTAGILRSAPFLDGDDIAHRYRIASPKKIINIGLPGWEYKDPAIYESEKILIRQAGVAIVATIDRTGAWCPQSIYIYRLTPETIYAGYSHEYLLAALLSRTMAYLIFKLFGEVDPDKAHPKLTHTRLLKLPMPKLDFTNDRHRFLHSQIVENVNRLLDKTDSLGSVADRQIEIALRELWGLSGDDGTYITSQFADLPDSQPLRELFPEGLTNIYR